MFYIESLDARLKNIVLKPAPLIELNDPELQASGVRVIVKRDDLIHPAIQGNKWYKLKYNFMRALREGYDTVLSFGGAYSNHIHALAAAGRLASVRTIGMIRGEMQLPLNNTLFYAASAGMQLHWLDRDRYRMRYDEEFLQELYQRFGRVYIVPEGGANVEGVKGAREIITCLTEEYDYVYLASGTGTSLAGISHSLKPGRKAVGVSVLRGGSFLKWQVKNLQLDAFQETTDNFSIETDYHFGGYAKIKPELVYFMRDFERRNGIPLEPVYTGKLFYALYDKIKLGEIPGGSTVLAIHSGGLQGLAGMTAKMNRIAPPKAEQTEPVPAAG